MGRESEVTRRQVRTFMEAVSLMGPNKPTTYSEVASRLKVSRQQVVSTLERLQAALKLESPLVVEGPEGLQLQRIDLVDTFEKLDSAFADLDRHARERPTAWWVRVDGFWAHLAAFLSNSIVYIKQRHPETTIELSPHFGESRSTAGANMAQRVATGMIDLAVVPSGPTPGGLARVDCHRAVVIAAVSESHPLQKFANKKKRLIELGAIVQERDPFPVLVSPTGHATRSMLERAVPSGMHLTVAFSGTDPSALVSFQHDSLTPLIASDSNLSALSTQCDPTDPWKLPKSWLAVSVDGKVLATDFEIIHRTFVVDSEKPQLRPTRFVPVLLAGILEEFARKSAEYASLTVQSRIRPWQDLEPVR